jgi:antitoxin HicB
MKARTSKAISKASRLRPKNKRTYAIILQPESDPDSKGYHNALVPALPGCLRHGENRAQALRNIREAIELCLENLVESGEPIPEDDIEEVRLEVAA